jgi:hypothetical protein
VISPESKTDEAALQFEACSYPARSMSVRSDTKAVTPVRFIQSRRLVFLAWWQHDVGIQAYQRVD